VFLLIFLSKTIKNTILLKTVDKVKCQYQYQNRNHIKIYSYINNCIDYHITLLFSIMLIENIIRTILSLNFICYNSF